MMRVASVVVVAAGPLMACALIEGATHGQGIFSHCDRDDDCTDYGDVCTVDGCRSGDQFGAGTVCTEDNDCNGGAAYSGAQCPASTCRCLGNFCSVTLGDACVANDDCADGFCAEIDRRCFRFFYCGTDTDCRDGDGICGPDLACEVPGSAASCEAYRPCSSGDCINSRCYTDTGKSCAAHADCPDPIEHCWGNSHTCLREVPN
jgi:hypothetical protein